MITENNTEPRWDSCDGRSSTYGWSVASEYADFTVGTESQVSVVDHVRAAMSKLGWAYVPERSGGKQWAWSRQVNGSTATAEMDAPQSQASPWSLDAEAPPAVNPSTGC